MAFLFFGTSLWAWTPGTSDPDALTGFSVDTTNRTDVLSFYNTVYSASQNYPSDISWTGNVATGMAGTTSATFKDDVQRRINFYRALVGRSTAITIDSTESSNDQLAALMFSANDQINHFPPTTWIDYTANGAMAAGNSNIALGYYGPGAVDAYITDTGSNNVVVGHRRWLLYSLSQVMGTGDIPPTGDGVYDGTGSNFSPTNAIWVQDNFATPSTSQFTCWPNSGYCPFPLMPARWSLSYPNANFATATVTMTQGGTSVPVTIISSTDNGYGDNTIVWEPSVLPTSLSADTPYTVTVSGIGGGGPTSYTYTVTLFDPNVLGQSVTITGSSTPPTTGASYTFNPISEADAYDLQVSMGSTATWNEGAENSPAPQVVADTTGSYPLIQSAVVHTGANAFQLAFPADMDSNNNYESYDFSDQSFEITRQIIPTATSQLQFWDLCRFVLPSSTLSAQISTDNGNTWTSVWSRAGVVPSGGSSANWDAAFIENDISLASYAGQVILVRFVLSGNGSGAYLGTSSYYGFFIDDITVTNATQLINNTVTQLASSATSFTLNATTAGAALQAGASYYLRISPEVGLKWYPYGAYDLVTAQTSSPITGYSSWVSALYPAVTGGPSGDYSADGIPNAYKYAFGLNPTVHNPAGSIPVPVLSGSNLTLSYTVPSGIVGVTYGAEWSTDLVTWTPITDTGSGNTHTFTVSITGYPRLFMRHTLTFAP